MDNNNKNLWASVIIVVVLVAGIAYWAMNRNSTSEQSPLAAQTPVTSTEDTTAGSVNSSASPLATLSYQQALLKYKDARIQLDKTCQATPNNVTYKNGTNIMIDNRAPVARTVKVGSTISIKGWGFKIVKLSSSTLPATWLVDCDTSQNVATILIQK